MPQPPLVSIIIPTYNRADLLVGAVDSALAQTYPRIEIIIVDDGSSDNTPEVAARYAAADPRITAVRNQTNLGNAAARNAGIDCARGEFLAFLDDDGCFAPQKISIQMDVLAGAGDKADLTYCNMWFDEACQKCSVSSELLSKTIEESDFFRNRYSVLCPSTWLCRRSLFVEIGKFDPALRCWVDMDLILRIFENKKCIYFLNRPLAVKRPAPGVSRVTPDYLFWKEKAIAKHFSLLKSHRKYLSRIYYSFGSDYDKICLYRMAQIFYWRALLYDPTSLRYAAKALNSARRRL